MHSLVPPASFRASSSDLEDCDRLGWLLELQPAARAEWRARLQWVSLVDFMAEERLLLGDNAGLTDHFAVPRDPAALGVSWCEAWQRYVLAVHRYLKPKVILPDLNAHREMLLELGGNVFCLLPEVDWSLRRSIAHFGALDCFFSQLLQLRHDLQRYRCHVPLHVLAMFDLAPQDLVRAARRGSYHFADMMRFWLDDYLPTLRFEASEFSELTGLPRALDLMRSACMHRHARIERAFREQKFDFGAAECAYWSEVESRCSVRLAAAG